MAHVKEFSVEEKLTSLVTLQKIESKMDEIRILKGELPMEVADLEDEITGLHSRQTRIEEEINGVTEFIQQRKDAIKDAEAQVKKYEKQSDNVKNNREFEAINKEMEMQELEVKKLFYWKKRKRILPIKKLPWLIKKGNWKRS